MNHFPFQTNPPTFFKKNPTHTQSSGGGGSTHPSNPKTTEAFERGQKPLRNYSSGQAHWSWLHSPPVTPTQHQPKLRLQIHPRRSQMLSRSVLRAIHSGHSPAAGGGGIPSPHWDADLAAAPDPRVHSPGCAPRPFSDRPSPSRGGARIAPASWNFRGRRWRRSPAEQLRSQQTSAKHSFFHFHRMRTRCENMPQRNL